MIEPDELARGTVLKVLNIGSMKEGRDESWRQRDVKFHIMKSITHNMRALQLLEGHIIDPETVLEHMERSLTRDAMALTVMLQD